LFLQIDYGEEVISLKKKQLPLKNQSFTPLHATLQHPHQDQFLGDLKMFSTKLFTDFSLSKEGSKTKSSSINASYEDFLKEGCLAVPVNEFGKAAIMNMSTTMDSVRFGICSLTSIYWIDNICDA